MPLNPGRTLSHYEILSPLGSGAMGEVWRARDTRLGREVAIKVLPEHFAADDERLRRFEREALVLASLNHPHIAQIYGVDQVEDTCFLVLELVPGETLDQRLQRGPLPLDEALEVCAEIAEGLEAAHEAGVVHRDLKPANVHLTPEGRVKLLDFGLAKPMGEAQGRAPSTDGVLSTEAGRLLGTPTYMAPEQARGKPIDKRVDVWAFGCVLFECLTGERAFAGETLADVLGAALHQDVDLDRLPAATPEHVRRVLRRCLERDKARRYRDVGDVHLDLLAPPSDVAPVPPPAGARRPVGLLAAVLGLGAALVAGALWQSFRAGTPEPAGLKRFGIGELDMPMDRQSSLAISPAGDRLIVRARNDEGVDGLYSRPLDSLELEFIPGSEGGWLPFFSPDGSQVGFFARAQLIKAASVRGGNARTIGVTSTGFSGGAWMHDDTIIFAGSSTRGLYEIPAVGGTPRPLDVDFPADVTLITAPSPVPGRDAVLCGVQRGGRFDIAVYSRASGELRVLVENGFQPIHAATGHVLYQQGDRGPLMAFAFDRARLTVTGRPFPVVADTAARISYQTQVYAVSADGTLALIAPSLGEDGSELVWVDPSGEIETITTVDRIIDMPRLSHDEGRIAYRSPAPDCDIWTYDLGIGATSRLTSAGDNHGIVWSSDDRYILTFSRKHDDLERIEEGALGAPVMLRTDGIGDPRDLHDPVPLDSFVVGASPDGALVLLATSREGSGRDIDAVDTQSRTLRSLISSRFDETGAALSPDGTALAYASNESGRTEVYLQPFPSLDSRVQVSAGGGSHPLWARDGQQLYFRRDDAIHAVPIQVGTALTGGRPFQVLARVPAASGFDVSSEGRFVMVRIPERSASRTQVEVLVNWFPELRRLDPRKGKN